MAYTVDSLQVEIATQSGKAVNGLRTLTTALQNLKSVTKVSLPSKLAENIKGIGDALKGISNEDIEKLERISNALQTFSDVKSNLGLPKLNINVKEVSKVSNEVDKVAKKATQITRMSQEEKENLEEFKNQINSIKTDTTKVSDLANIISAQAFKANPLIAGINKTIDSLKSKLQVVKKLADALGRVAFYRAIRTALKEITDAFSEGLKNAYAFSKQDESFKRLADALDRIASMASQMRNQLGAMIGELLTQLTPLIDKLISRVTKFATYLTEMFAALSGEDTYLQAQLTSVYWDEAADSVKKYKQQLLGIDEINNLTSQSASGSGNGVDVADMFKEVNVSAKFKTIVSIKNKIAQELESLSSVVTGFEIALGTILLFSGANIPLGLGFLAHATYRGINEISENWDGIGDTIEKRIGTIEGLLGGAELGIGAIIAFSGANIPLGLGLILEGVKDLGLSAANIKWTELSQKTQKRINQIETFAGFAELGIGAILAFSGANIPVGIGLMLSGAKTWGDQLAKLDWDAIKKSIQSSITEIETLVGLAGGAIGAVLLFTGANVGLGIGMLLSSGLLVGAAADWSWDGLLSNLQSTFGSIKTWWTEHVSPAISKAIYELESLFQIDLNGDGTVGYKQTTSAPFSFVKQVYDSPEMAPKMFDTLANGTVAEKHELSQGILQDIKFQNYVDSHEQPSAIKQIWEDTKQDTKRFLDDISNDFKRSALGQIFGYAKGGFPSQGTLFYAGESGPEFVGNMGGQTAVANTDQMGDAIRQAAYEGMSQALREHGGTLVLSPDADKIFNITMEKGREYTRMTGQPWAY